MERTREWLLENSLNGNCEYVSNEGQWLWPGDEERSLMNNFDKYVCLWCGGFSMALNSAPPIGVICRKCGARKCWKKSEKEL